MSYLETALAWTPKVDDEIRYRLTNGDTRAAIIFRVANGRVYYRDRRNGQASNFRLQDLRQLIIQGSIELVREA
jgi:hypothetical protein